MEYFYILVILGCVLGLVLLCAWAVGRDARVRRDAPRVDPFEGDEVLRENHD